MKQKPTPSPLWLMLCLVLASISANAQTFNAGANKYEFDNIVNSIVHDAQGNTYVGGDFTGVTPWCGSAAQFSAAGVYNENFPKVAGGSVTVVIPIPGGGWYIGGVFSSVNGETRKCVARINADGTLHPFNANILSGSVGALLVDASGNLYVGGSSFIFAGFIYRYGICKFDNTGALTAFSPQLDGTVYDFAVDGSGNLFVGGGFATVGGSTTRRGLCKFDNTGALTSFDPHIGGVVYALVLDGAGNLYAGGSISTVGSPTSVTRNNLCKFDNTGTLTSFAPILGSTVAALAVDAGGNLYAGGYFTTIGATITRRRICKFDNTGALTSFDPNMSNSVEVLAVDGSGNLYAGGNFTSVGGSTARNYLCKFDNTGALTSFDPNMNYAVQSLALDGSGNLYAGGVFTSVGGTTRNRLCKFDNTGTLTTFDPNMDGITVRALAIDGSGNLYAGGYFTMVGGSTARNSLCKFDNIGTLTSFNPNVSGWVYSLALDGSGNLYVGGSFSSVSSTPRSSLCKFDNGGNLMSFNPNLVYEYGTARVYTMATDGAGNLYVGGEFALDDGTTPRYNFCKFDNAGSLTSVQLQISSNVRTLAIDPVGKVFIGGEFGSPSPRLAILCDGACGTVTSIGSSASNDSNFGKEIIVYPNPTAGTVSIDLNGVADASAIQVKDMLGKTVYSSAISKVNTKAFAIEGEPGIYFIELSNTKGERAVFRVVKQ